MTRFEPEQDWTGIEGILNELQMWLDNNVKAFLRENTEIDLWEEYKNGEKILDISKIDFDDRTTFSLEERSQIKLAINDLKLLIQRKFEIDNNEKASVNRRLDYLIEASERLNKFDWKSLAISTIMSISITLSLDTVRGQQLFEMFKQLFSMIPKLTGH